MTGVGGAWLADPSGRHQTRYWDGSRWTAQVADDGVQGEDRFEEQPLPPLPAETPPGWHRDPLGSQLWRYWDGTSWTSASASSPVAAGDGPKVKPGLVVVWITAALSAFLFFFRSTDSAGNTTTIAIPLGVVSMVICLRLVSRARAVFQQSGNPLPKPYRAARVVAVLLAALSVASAVIAMTTGSSNDSASTSQTPRIQSNAPELRAGLVSNADLRGLSALPALQEIPTKSAPLFQNPDPRGPCGARLQQPDLSRGASIVFGANRITVTDTVIRVDQASAQAFADAVIADTRPACPMFVSKTNTGATQTVTPGQVIDLPAGLANQQTAVTASFSLMGQTAYAGEILLRQRDLVAFGVMFSADPIASTTVRDYAARVSDALRKLD